MDGGIRPSEGDGEEKERFWKDMDRVSNGYRLCILRDLNGWVLDRVRGGISNTYGLPGENDNGRRVMKFCAERGLCVGNTYFDKGACISAQGWQGFKTEFR